MAERKMATAIRYDKENSVAPELVAKGMGVVAEKIIEKAEASDVPIYKDQRLSQQLYNLELGEEIPPELYEVVAEVLVFIATMDQG